MTLAGEQALRLMAKKDVSLLAKFSAPNGNLEAAVAHMQERGRRRPATCESVSRGADVLAGQRVTLGSL